MEYHGRALGGDTVLSPEREGLRIGRSFLDWADVASLKPVNHRVLLETLAGETVEISMLGFSFDGFWEELSDRFGARSRESLFVEETLIMRCEGEYETAFGRGRGRIELYGDSVCILPPDCGAARIPLCFSGLREDGYLLRFAALSGDRFTVGRMGYDTHPFAERAAKAIAQVKETRMRAVAALPLQAPFTHKGLFRTGKPEQYWLAAFGNGCCAVELFTGDDAATYLYRFSEPRETFLRRLEEAMEAMGPHREIIWMAEEQLRDKPLYRMAVQRSASVRFLRARSAGRLIHSVSHAEKLSEFLRS